MYIVSHLLIHFTSSCNTFNFNKWKAKILKLLAFFSLNFELHVTQLSDHVALTCTVLHISLQKVVKVTFSSSHACFKWQWLQSLHTKFGDYLLYSLWMLPYKLKVHGTKVRFIYSFVWKPLKELEVAFVQDVHEKNTTVPCAVYIRLHSEKALIHMQPSKYSSLD
jgi:hypothetical protein